MGCFVLSPFSADIHAVRSSHCAVYLTLFHSLPFSQANKIYNLDQSERIFKLLSFVNLGEFGLQTIRHCCPCVRCSLAVPTILLSGPVGFHVAQTLLFQRFMACPPRPFAFGAFLCKVDALVVVGDTCVLQTMCSLDWIGPRRPRVQKSEVL